MEEGKSSPMRRRDVEESSAMIAKAEIPKTIALNVEESGTYKVSWLPSSSESESDTDDEAPRDHGKENCQVWEIPLEEADCNEKEKRENYNMLPQIRQAIGIMLGNTEVPSTAPHAESRSVVSLEKSPAQQGLTDNVDA